MPIPAKVHKIFITFIESVQSILKWRTFQSDNGRSDGSVGGGRGVGQLGGGAHVEDNILNEIEKK